jgi:23S rRNA pseudouridine2605 synthase
VLDALPGHVRLYPVGRLDYNTTGALLVTNDGELAHRLMHPRSKVPKVYLATVSGVVDQDALRRLRRGVRLDDGPTQPAEVEVVGRPRPGLTELRIVLTEGRNRQVRRILESVGHQVVKLARTHYDGLELGHLKPGEWRALRREGS